jgi:hypothetical protein
MNRTFTVNVPENFPAVDSDTAERMAAVALRQRIALAPDAVGSGSKVLRLTVSEDVAQRLHDLSGGSMALAWRRLFSTVAEHAGVARRIPNPSPRAALPASRGGSTATDGGWWVGKGQLQIAEGPAQESALTFVAPGIFTIVSRSKPQAQPLAVAPRPAMKPWQWLAVLGALAVGIAALIGSSGGASAAVASVVAPGPRFPAWRPR